MHISTHLFVTCKGPHPRVSCPDRRPAPYKQEAVPGHAYTAHTKAQEHTSHIACTNTSQHTSCTGSADSCLTTSHIDSRGYDSSIKGLHLSHSPCTSTLKAKSHITSSVHYTTKASQLFHTFTPAHNFSPQLQNLIELQILHNIP